MAVQRVSDGASLLKDVRWAQVKAKFGWWRHKATGKTNFTKCITPQPALVLPTRNCRTGTSQSRASMRHSLICPRRAMLRLVTVRFAKVGSVAASAMRACQITSTRAVASACHAMAWLSTGCSSLGASPLRCWQRAFLSGCKLKTRARVACRML